MHKKKEYVTKNILMFLLHLIFLIQRLKFSNTINFFRCIIFDVPKAEREKKGAPFRVTPEYGYRVREVEENPRSGGTNQLTDRSSSQDTAL